MKRLARTVAPVIVAFALVLAGGTAALAASKSPVSGHGNTIVLPVTPGPMPAS